MNSLTYNGSGAQHIIDKMSKIRIEEHLPFIPHMHWNLSCEKSPDVFFESLKNFYFAFMYRTIPAVKMKQE